MADHHDLISGMFLGDAIESRPRPFGHIPQPLSSFRKQLPTLRTACGVAAVEVRVGLPLEDAKVLLAKRLDDLRLETENPTDLSSRIEGATKWARISTFG